MAAVAPPRVRPYRRYLTSVFHRRFVHASALVLLVCYGESILLSNSKSFIWTWFPLGPAGMRALCLYACCLAIFILRISQLQIGARSTPSSFDSFRRTVLRPSILQHLFWYTFSAWWFSELYIWLSPADAKLGWVDHDPLRKRDKLNERPIYLRSVYLQLALVQVALHIYRGADHIIIPSTKPSAKTGELGTHKIEPVHVQLQKIGPKILWRSALTTLFTVVPSPFVYTLLFRGIFWSSHMAFAKLFYNIPRSNANPETYPPSNITLIFKALYTGFCLVSLWEGSNFLFSALLAQEPLKKNLPLSTESKDPNGTLLSGLKAKKETVNSFAFWELAHISQKLPDRRKAIFADFERAGAPTWTQMLQSSLSIIQSIETRIKTSQAPPGKPPSADASAAATQLQIQSLPRLAPDVKPADNIFATSPPPRTRTEKLESTIGPLARSLGQSPPWSPSAKERVKELLEYPSQVTSEASTATLSSNGPSFLPGLLRPYAQIVLRSPVGSPFRHEFPRLLSSIILSSPNAQTALIVDAIESTTRMLIASLSEDLYGRVQATVPDTVRTFTSTINAIDGLIDNMKPHWTDIEFEAKGAEVPEDVDIVLERLKNGLDELLSAFQLYLREVGLSDADLKAAKEAVKPKPRKRLPKALKSQPQQAQSNPSEAKSTSFGVQKPQPRRRLEERDRGKDLEFLNAPLPPKQNSVPSEPSAIKQKQKTLPSPSAAATAGGIEDPFGLHQKNIPGVFREMQQVR